ncbi:hypothetical protein HN51_058827 [Arachis hypogaea]
MGESPVDLPPWFSVLSIVLNSNVDLDVSRIETAPQSMLPIICFRDGSPPLPDALSMANSAISEKNPYDIDKQITIGFCSCDRNHGGFDCSIEIVLLGDMGAGKTSLVLRFVKVQFSEYQESTIGAAFFTQVLSLNEATVKFDIWDTTGQERYHSLAPMYYRGADAAIVVYDITSMESFARAKKWVQQVQRHANPSLIMFLVANKADLGAERKVANEDGEEYAKENGLSFLETSAKTAQNVNKLFYEIVWRKEIGKSKPFTPNWNQAASHTSRNQKKQLVLLLQGDGFVDTTRGVLAPCKCTGNNKRGSVSCTERVGLLRYFSWEDKVLERPDYRSHSCKSVHESSSQYFSTPSSLL